MSDLAKRLRDLAGLIHPTDRPTIYKSADEIERLTAQVESLQNKWANRELSQQDSDALMAENERLQARVDELEAHKKTLSKAVMELSELVPDKKFWACPTCTAVNPEQRKLCVNGCGRDRAATEQGEKDD